MKDESNNLVESSATTLEAAPAGAAPAAAAGPGAPKKPSRLPHLLNFHNKYFFMFILLLLSLGAITYIALNMSKKATPNTTAVQSLTDQQLASLKGTTTIVGDSQQTLDVQSNAVFEGQVLLRNSLDVAGSLKVGGGLSLPTVTVGGSSSFGSTQVNGTLSVAGDTTLQGQVNLQKDLAVVGTGSFGSLSTGKLSVNSFLLNGDFTINRHIVVAGALPTRSNGPALGGGGTASVSGSDTAGTVNINTGGSPAAGCFITVSFSQKFSAVPHVVISPSNSKAGGLDYYTDRSATGFSVCVASPPAGSTNYVFDYIVIN